MSVKAQSLVWDFECPQTVNGLEFKPSHKYVLISYADHADHYGKSIFPAVHTISIKTGLDDRTIQRLTHDLVMMSLLIEDGQGPRGTNRWKLPFSEKGDKLSPPANLRGDKNEKSLGDIPSGDISSGDKMTPDLKEHNLINLTIYTDNDLIIWEQAKKELQKDMKRASFETWVRDTQPLGWDGDVLVVSALNTYARDWLRKNVLEAAQQITGKYIDFAVVTAEVLEAA